MKIRKIASAATAVMMAAMTLVPQIPSAFPGTSADFAITAEAAKNAVEISVVDAVTGELLPDIDVVVGPNRDTVAEGEGAYKWNTSDECQKEIEGAYNSDLYVSLKNVPDGYLYDEIYTINKNTRTFGDFKIRLRPKKCEPNFILRFYIEGETPYSKLHTINFNIYDKSGNWISAVNNQYGVFLQDGDYVLKADKDALGRAGYSISGPAEKELTVKGGKLDLKHYTDEKYDTSFDVKMDYTEDMINTRFYIKDGEDGEPNEEGVGLVQIKGDSFFVSSGGALYLGDGHYVAHRNAITKDPFKISRFGNSDNGQLEAFADQILNDVEDIEFNIVDGKPDRELVFVKKPVAVPNEETEKSDAKITVRDAATGKNIEGIDVEVIAGINATANSIAKWNTSDEAEKILKDLTVNPNYKYGVQLSNVPSDYNYKDKYIFDVAKGGITENWTVELEKKQSTGEPDPENKGTSAKVAVRDMATGKNIEGIDIEAIAGVNATGKSIAKWNTSDEAEKLLTGLSGNMQIAYGIKLKNVPEKYVHEDTYVFMRTEGTDVEDWTISLVTSDISDNITFDIYDWSEEKMFDFNSYDKPMYAKITDKDGNFCYGFSGAYPRALPDGEYTFELVTPPEGYEIVLPDSDTAKELKEKFLLSQIDGGIINFTMKDGKPDKEIVFDIIKKPVKEGIGFRLYSRYKGLWDKNGGVGSVTIRDEKGNVFGEYDLNEKISLPDGKYTSDIFVNCKGYGCFSEASIEFNVEDGKADRNLDYNIEVWNFNENGSGDANGDQNVDISDSVLIMQSIANPSKYGVSGSDKGHITEEGNARADVDGGGVTNMDALTIQEYLLGFFRVN